MSKVKLALEVKAYRCSFIVGFEILNEKKLEFIEVCTNDNGAHAMAKEVTSGNLDVHV